MTTHSAACSLAIRGAAFPPGTGSPASRPPPPAPPRHTTAPAAGSAAPREQDLAQSLCPPPQHTCPLPTRLTSRLAAARPAAHLPRLRISLGCLAGPFRSALPGFLVEGPGSIPRP